jgi:hypothetical protein
MSAPSEFKIAKLVNDLNLETLETSTKLIYSNIKDGKKPLRVLLKGELTTNGITSKDFNNSTVYSFGLKLSNSEDSEAMNSIIENVGKLSGLETKPMVDEDDRMFIKLQYDDKKKKFAAKSNIKLDAKKLDDLDLYRGQNVEVYAEIGAWYNKNDEKDVKAGIIIRVTKLEFEQDEPAKKKRKD